MVWQVNRRAKNERLVAARTRHTNASTINFLLLGYKACGVGGGGTELTIVSLPKYVSTTWCDI